jgi:two-component system response regulator FixJ
MPECIVHIVDDDAAVRRTLARLLEIAGYSVRLHETALDLINALPTIEPGCLLLDVRMPQMDGITLQHELGRGKLAVIMMTGHADIEMAVRAMQRGAVDFLEKPFTDFRLIAALDRGFTSLGSIRETATDNAEAIQRLAVLSKRELQVLTCLADGKPNKVIAHELGISLRTVEVHRANMLRRLGVGGLAEALRLHVLASLGA